MSSKVTPPATTHIALAMKPDQFTGRLARSATSAPSRAAARNSARKSALRQVPAVTRAVAILRLLANSESPQSLNEIARAIDVIPSTCLNILRILVSEELVAHKTANKRYHLDAGLLALARPLLRADSLGHKVQIHLDKLAQEFKVTTTLVEVIGLRHFIVIAVSKAEGLRLQIDIGRRAPALISATGRCVAAFGHYPTSELAPAFSQLRWDNAPTFKSWLQESDTTRKRGYGIDRNNYISGMTSIAAPVFDQNNALTHCLTAVGMTGQIKPVGMRAIGKTLVNLARSISA